MSENLTLLARRRDTPCFPPGPDQLLVYEWHAWQGFLVSQVFPHAFRLSAHVDDSIEAILDTIPKKTTAFLFHLDCSRTHHFPHQRSALTQALSARGIHVSNRATTDITKRHLQSTCRRLGLNSVQADREGDPYTRLIVKTNLNSGGYGERRLSAAERRLLRVPAPFAPINNATEYRVLTRRDIPSAWWAQPALTIERYIENQANRIHRVHVAGPRLVLSTGVAAGVLRRFGTERQRINYFLTRETLAENSAPSQAVAQILQQVLPFLEGFQLDYGAIDVVEDETGTPYIIDVNTTPGWGEAYQPGLFEHLRGCALCNTRNTRTQGNLP